MRARIVVGAVALVSVLTAGCMTLGARRYYEACLKAGYNEGECEMLALEVDRQAWQQINNALQEFNRNNRPSPMIQPAPLRTTCYPIGGGLMECR